MTSTVQRRDDQSGRVTRKALYRIPEAMALLSMSRTVVYEQIRRGRLRSVKQGRTRLIPAAAIAEYVALLEQETGWRAAA
jgi:excisionase family DNA binding protein